jgi:hypothetical protein
MKFNRMKKFIAVVGFSTLAAAGAFAGHGFSFSAHFAPPPIYAAPCAPPAPVYVAPPVCVVPAPGVVAAPPVVYVAPPRIVISPPAFSFNFGFGGGHYHGSHAYRAHGKHYGHHHHRGCR